MAASYKNIDRFTTPEEAKAHYEECIEAAMAMGSNREEAEYYQRANITYVAGYYDPDVRERILKLYGFIKEK